MNIIIIVQAEIQTFEENSGFSFDFWKSEHRSLTIVLSSRRRIHGESQVCCAAHNLHKRKTLSNKRLLETVTISDVLL